MFSIHGTYHVDTLHLHALSGKVDHHTKNVTQQHHDDCRDDENKLDPKFFDQPSLTLNGNRNHGWIRSSLQNVADTPIKKVTFLPGSGSDLG